jgi:hypothetical protein
LERMPHKLIDTVDGTEEEEYPEQKVLGNL